jgi:CRISPR-associated protein Cas2
MYYIIAYDVNQKRVNKVLKLLRKYLNWVQNSVFEGELSDSQLEKLKHEVKKIMISDEDSIIIYSMESKWLGRDIIGLEKKEISTII